MDNHGVGKLLLTVPSDKEPFVKRASFEFFCAIMEGELTCIQKN